MPWLLNVVYLLVVVLAAPWLLWRRWRAGKRLGGGWAKFTGNVISSASRAALAPGVNGQRIWLHAVSVGEVLLLQPIIKELKAQYPQWEVWLSVTTATGRDVAEKTYPELNIIWFPFDFTWAVHRALNQVQPRLILLAELELWPNFISIAKAKSIPVIVVNGRISERSFKGYHRFRWLVSKLLGKIDRFAVQQEEYAERLKLLGMPADRIVVTGSVKFDGVTVDRQDASVQKLRTLFGITEKNVVWVVGSTQTPEEAWALDIYQTAKKTYPNLVLILVPRHQERFNEVAELITKSGEKFSRRSALSTEHSALILVDTLGELKAVWGLADVGFVGGSFNDRGGQNMIEPAAYGVAVTFGPNTWNFKQVVAALLMHQAAMEVKTKAEWEAVTLRLLGDGAERRELGERAREFVLRQQGATERTVGLLKSFLSHSA
ncbi:MAG: 3-deoxy-D-manno-octulosonic acid transferase [Gemmatales bacterium]